MSDFLSQNNLIWLIAILGVVVFITRIGGYLIISQFGRIHPRIEIGLNAVPAAVMATLVFPAAINAGWIEIVTIILVAAACLQLPTIGALIFGLLFLIVARGFFGI